MKRILRWSVVILLVAAVVAVVVYAVLPQPVSVTIADVRIGPMQWTIDEEGKTRIRERYVVSAPLTGRLQRITLDAGDAVRAEQTILAVVEPTDPELLDPRAVAEAEARVRAAEASVRQAQANAEREKAEFEFARDELARVVQASEQGASSPRELDRASADEITATEAYRAAQYALEIAQFELQVARSALLYTTGEESNNDRVQMTLRSPIDGAVLRVFQESVAVVTPGTPLLEVGDPSDLEIVIDVLSSDAVKITPGDRVVISHWGGDDTLEARVRLVEPSGFTKVSALGIEEQRVNVIADFTTPAQQRATLGDGFRVEAGILIWEAPRVLQIPTSAAFRQGDEWVVFKVVDHKAVVQPIEIGRQTGQTTQVLSGLAEADRVVVHPSDQLDDGVRVASREN